MTVFFPTLSVKSANIFFLSDSLNFELTFFQSNSESEIIDKIHATLKNYSALIINAGAFTHTSVAIHDSLKILSCPIIEVHLSNLSKREKFRHKSLSYLS